MDNLIFHFLKNKKIAWAPNKGIKDKLKSYWNVDTGCTYVPWSELNNIEINFVSLSDGGFVDEITIPENLIDIYYEKMDIKKEKEQQPREELSIEMNKQEINLIENNQYFDNLNELFDPSRPPPLLQFSHQHQNIHHIQQQQKMNYLNNCCIHCPVNTKCK